MIDFKLINRNFVLLTAYVELYTGCRNLFPPKLHKISREHYLHSLIAKNEPNVMETL